MFNNWEPAYITKNVVYDENNPLHKKEAECSTTIFSIARVHINRDSADSFT